MASFSIAVTLVISREGGLVNDQNDPGGLSKYGISQRSYPALDIAALTVNQAQAIYLRDFWCWDGWSDQVTANKFLDMSVNLGQPTAIGIFQTIAGVPVDRVYGPVTDNALLRVPDLIGRLRQCHVQHYVDLIAQRPSAQMYWNGWLYRAVQ